MEIELEKSKVGKLLEITLPVHITMKQGTLNLPLPDHLLLAALPWHRAANGTLATRHIHLESLQILVKRRNVLEDVHVEPYRY